MATATRRRILTVVTALAMIVLLSGVGANSLSGFGRVLFGIMLALDVGVLVARYYRGELW